MTLVQTNCDWPKKGASARGAVISMTRTPAPERNAVRAWMAITGTETPRGAPEPRATNRSVELDRDAGGVDLAPVAVGAAERPGERILDRSLQRPLEALRLRRVGGAA